MSNKNLKPIVIGIVIIACIFAAALVLSNVLDGNGNESDIIIYEETTTESESVGEDTTEEIYEMFDGYKRYEYDNGDIYDGNWNNNLYSGEGTLYKKTGEIYEGIWKDGEFILGDVTYKINNFGGTRTVRVGWEMESVVHEDKILGMMQKNGNIYDGEILFEDKKNGVGIMYDVETKKIYDGVWEDDYLFEGTITSLYSDGLHTYSVEVKDGFYNGKGILYDENGKIEQEELWRDDQLINE